MSRTKLSLVALLAVTVIGGVALSVFGVGAELSEWRDVRMTVVCPEVLPVVATQVKVGDPVFTDPAAMRVGVIEEVVVTPTLRANPDAAGVLRVSEDPLARTVKVVIAAPGRSSEEIVAIGNQVVQVGMEFALVSTTYQLQGWIAEIDVR